MKFCAVVPWIKPDSAVGWDRASPIGNHPAEPRMRSDVHVVENDTFFQLRSAVNAHASADD